MSKGTGEGKTAIEAKERELLAAEARRQSELVSRNEQDADGYQLADTSDWSWSEVSRRER